MRFAKHLCKIGDDFRRVYFNSTDASDQTVMADDWRKMQVSFTVLCEMVAINTHINRSLNWTCQQLFCLNREISQQAAFAN
jgi:hypothetical protein